MTSYQMLRENFSFISPRLIPRIGKLIRQKADEFEIERKFIEQTETFLVMDYPEDFKDEMMKIAQSYLDKANEEKQKLIEQIPVTNRQSILPKRIRKRIKSNLVYSARKTA